MIEKEILEIEKFLGDEESDSDFERVRKEYILYYNPIREKYQADYETVFEILCGKYPNANRYYSYYNILLCMKLWGGRR